MDFNPISLKTKNFLSALLELEFPHLFLKKILLDFCLSKVLGTKDGSELI